MSPNETNIIISSSISVSFVYLSLVLLNIAVVNSFSSEFRIYKIEGANAKGGALT